MKKRTKWTVAGAIGLAIVIIGVTSAMKGRNKATEVRMEKVQRRDLVASVTASGQVQPHTKVDVSADISGRIVQLAVKEGQMVTKGQFLLEIDPSQYRANVERATAAVASARSRKRPACRYCHPSPCPIVASVTPSNRWTPSMTRWQR